MEPTIEAARLMDTDEPTGDRLIPLACYVSEAIENELDAMSAKERRRGYDDRFRLAIRRASNNAAVYAEPWALDPLVFRAAVNLRRI